MKNSNTNQQLVLVAGASGATGRYVVKHLLDNGHQVRAIVRTPENLPDFLKNREGLTVIKAAILDLSDEEMQVHVNGCDAVVSCLGHNLTFKGIYGKPRRLVTDAVQRLCNAIIAIQPEKKIKFILMNTTGNQNHDLHEPISFAQKCVLGLLRLTLPPHVDNEKAADVLRVKIGQNHPVIEWTAVRPDGLIDTEEVSEYEIHPSPIRSAIFDAGKVSRINVAHFMYRLTIESSLWNNWEGQMPVIYSVE